MDIRDTEVLAAHVSIGGLGHRFSDTDIEVSNPDLSNTEVSDIQVSHIEFSTTQVSDIHVSDIEVSRTQGSRTQVLDIQDTKVSDARVGGLGHRFSDI